VTETCYRKLQLFSILPYGIFAFFLCIAANDNFCINFGNIITMPIITVAMYSGRTQREKDRLTEAITEEIVYLSSYSSFRILNLPLPSFFRSIY
jgi:hypothetical protein